jgi:hypothetical protein
MKTNDKTTPVLINLDKIETLGGLDAPLAIDTVGGLMGFVAFPGKECELGGAAFG